MNDPVREELRQTQVPVPETAVAEPARLQFAMPPLAPPAPPTRLVPLGAGVFGLAVVLGAGASMVSPGVGLAVFPTLVWAAAALSLTGWRFRIEPGQD